MSAPENEPPFPILIPKNSKNRFQKTPVKPAVVVRVKTVERECKNKRPL
jgi:hypothetical protein